MATLTLANGTATAGSDYTNVGPVVVTFAQGETSKSVAVPILEDALFEGDETVALALATPTAGRASGRRRRPYSPSRTTTPAAACRCNDVQVAEGNAGNNECCLHGHAGCGMPSP